MRAGGSLSIIHYTKFVVSSLAKPICSYKYDEKDLVNAKLVHAVQSRANIKYQLDGRPCGKKIYMRVGNGKQRIFLEWPYIDEYKIIGSLIHDWISH